MREQKGGSIIKMKKKATIELGGGMVLRSLGSTVKKFEKIVSALNRQIRFKVQVIKDWIGNVFWQVQLSLRA